jgi:23S rRNA (uracil1939-C5)-methyltransferase
MARRRKRTVRDVSITGIADKGMAVGRSPEGEVIFVNGAVPGDVVDVLILRIRKKVAQGVVLQFKKKSEERISPFCKHFLDCGGCKWQNLSYESQLHHKWINVKDAVTRLAKLDENLIEPILGSVETERYRNKLEYSFASKRFIPKAELDKYEDVPTEPGLGFHVAGAWDKVLDLDECYLQDDRTNQIRLFIKKYCLDNNYSFYDPRSHKGLMRNTIVRNTTLDEWMLIIVFSKREMKKIEGLLQAINRTFDFITSLNYVVNEKVNDTLYDQDIINYSGRDYIIEQLGDVRYKVGPKSFFQTNTKQAIRLFDTVVEFAELKGDENVYDLYTGLGSIALYIADKVKHVTGIEEVVAAIEDANENAIFNNIANTTFYAGDVKDILTADFSEKHGKPDLVISDPPRAGMHGEVCNTLLKLEAPRIVYVSCNPSSQARDLVLLSEKYDVDRIKPVDMFPHTHHIENVVLLVLRS